LAVFSSTILYINAILFTVVQGPFMTNPWLNPIVFGSNLDSICNDIGLLLLSNIPHEIMDTQIDIRSLVHYTWHWAGSHCCSCCPTWHGNVSCCCHLPRFGFGKKVMDEPQFAEIEIQCDMHRNISIASSSAAVTPSVGHVTIEASSLAIAESSQAAVESSVTEPSTLR
jgi:hypothetical protein